MRHITVTVEIRHDDGIVKFSETAVVQPGNSDAIDFAMALKNSIKASGDHLAGCSIGDAMRHTIEWLWESDCITDEELALIASTGKDGPSTARTGAAEE